MTTHTARRDHRCADCGRTVRAQVPGGGRTARVAFHTACYKAALASAERKK